MRRRDFITLVGGVTIAWPLAARAQQAGKVYRVGWFFSSTPLDQMAGPDPILPLGTTIVHRLRDLGYVEGQNLILERRSAEGNFERIDEIATELVGRKPDAILTGAGNMLALALQRVTKTIPIVMPDGRPGDPAKAVATRWTFDLAANTDTFKQERVDDLAGEFPRFDERFAGLTYRHGFFAARTDGSGDFDTLAHMDPKTNTRSVYKLPRGDAISESIFVPRSADAPERDGYLLATIYRGAKHRSDLAVFDATALEKGPIAIAELSHRLPFGFHGNWRPAA